MEEAIQSSIYLATPDFAGWLQKRGFAWRKLWKKRWVAINGAEIAYMDKEPTTENLKSVHVSKAHITASTIVRDDDDPEHNELGFSIHLNDGQQQTWYLRAETPREKKNWVIRLGYVIAIVKWLESFEKLKVLGVGGSGIVYELLHKSNGKRFAMKEIEIKTQKMRDMAVREAEMLKDIMENIIHPNILHIEKVFQVGSKFYLVFPLCTGGELYEHIIRRGHFSERDAAKIVRDLVSALHALHTREILHLDIKPENILFDSLAPDAQIKLTDFGISRIIAGGNERVKAKNASEQDFSLAQFEYKTLELENTGYLDISKVKGTIGYMSPELILMNYASKAADIFAAGVILYILLFGRPPFPGQSDRAVLEKTACGKALYRKASRWESVSPEARDLVDKMLCHNPLTRISSEDILKHPWIVKMEEGESQKLAKKTESAAAVESAKVSAKLSPTPVDVSESEKNENMRATLINLSKHVTQNRTMKMANSLMAIMQASQKSSTPAPERKKTLLGEEEENENVAYSLAELYLKPAQPRELRRARSFKGEVLSEKELVDAQGIARDEDVLAVLNTDLRDAINRVLNKLKQQEKEKNGQFPPLQREDSLGLETGSFDELDADKDQGFFSIELFLKLVRSLHYSPESPGSSYVLPSLPQNAAPALLFARFMDRDNDGKVSLSDIIDAQAQMLQRSEPFLKLVFRMYIESVWYPGRQLNTLQLFRQTFVSTASSEEDSPHHSSLMQEKDSVSKNNIIEPPKVLTVRHVSAVFEKLGYDVSLVPELFHILCDKAAKLRRGEVQALTSSLPLPSFPKANVDMEASQNSAHDSLETSSFSTENRNTEALQSASQGEKQSVKEEEGENDSMESPTNSDVNENDDEHESRENVSPDQNQKLDIDDFLRLCRVEDVLIQVVFQRPRQVMSLIVKRAQKLAAEDPESRPPSYFIEQEILMTMDEIEAAQGAGENKPGARLAAAGRVALSAAFDFASKFAQSLSPTEDDDTFFDAHDSEGAVH